MQQPDSQVMSIEVIERLAQETSIEVLPQLLEMFESEIKMRIAKLHESVDAKDINEVAEQAHALKSCSGTFGANQLYHQAMLLEQKARGEAQSIEQLSSEIESIFLAVESTLDAYQTFDATTITNQ